MFTGQHRQPGSAMPHNAWKRDDNGPDISIFSIAESVRKPSVVTLTTVAFGGSAFINSPTTARTNPVTCAAKMAGWLTKAARAVQPSGGIKCSLCVKTLSGIFRTQWISISSRISPPETLYHGDYDFRVPVAQRVKTRNVCWFCRWWESLDLYWRRGW